MKPVLSKKELTTSEDTDDGALTEVHCRENTVYVRVNIVFVVFTPRSLVV